MKKILLALTICFSSHLIAQETIVLSDSSSRFVIHYKYLAKQVNPSFKNIPSYDEVKNSEFAPVTKPYLSDLIENWNSIQWYKIKVKSNASHSKHWIIEFRDRNTSFIEIFTKNKDGKLSSSKTGFELPYAVRDYKNQTFMFDIYPNGTESEIYFKIKSAFSYQFKASIKTIDQAIQNIQIDYCIQGIYCGFILLVIINTLFMYFSLKDPLYIHYGIYILCCLIGFLRNNNLGFQFLWPSHPEINPYILEIGTICFVFSLSNYANAFLNNKKDAPFFYYLSWLFKFVISIIYVYESVFLGQPWFTPWYLIEILVWISCISAIFAIFRNEKQAKYFLFGSVFIFVDFVVPLFDSKGYLTNHDYYYYMFPFSIMIEITVFYFALSKRIHSIEKERKLTIEQKNNVLNERNMLLENRDIVQKEIIFLTEKVNRELEAKVMERTAEINLKNSTLISANDNLNLLYKQMEFWNVKLDKQNWELNKEVKEANKAKVFEGFNTNDTDFNEAFPNENTCLKYLNDLKWEDGFICSRCKNNKWSNGQLPYSRICTKCNCAHTITKGTILFNSKIPIKKAFYIIYATFKTKEKITVKELSEKLGLGMKACWTFKKKITDRMAEPKRKKIKSWHELILD